MFSSKNFPGVHHDSCSQPRKIQIFQEHPRSNLSNQYSLGMFYGYRINQGWVFYLILCQRFRVDFSWIFLSPSVPLTSCRYPEPCLNKGVEFHGEPSLVLYLLYHFQKSILNPYVLDPCFHFKSRDEISLRGQDCNTPGVNHLYLISITAISFKFMRQKSLFKTLLFNSGRIGPTGVNSRLDGLIRMAHDH